ncbi:AraC family ligand binding domain-containing protein [Bacteroides gallinaceum]|nr:AraC family ligand binding domain-containing protein [Bacteroides gallinaceum]MDM8208291.1 AraC family ligand binding domain-containing protein [Bacteroides gallinaceum]
MQKNMPQQLPQHKAFMLSDFGVRLRRIVSPQAGNEPVPYTHQDEYYIVGLLEKGMGCGVIDFKECSFSQGEIFLVQPGQAHRFVSSKDAEGWILFADSSFVGREEKNIFDNFLLFASAVKIGGRRMEELKQIAGISLQRGISLSVRCLNECVRMS